MLGIGSGWWSVAGLLLDVAGFGILMWDIVPEHRVTVARLKLREIQQRITQAELKSILEPPRNYKTERLEGELPKLCLRTLRQLACSFGARDFMRTFDKEYDAETRLENGPLEKFAGTIGGKLQDRSDRLAMRPRPPIRIAVVFIISGFFLQLDGAIPTCPDASIDWPWTSCPVQIETPVAALAAPAGSISGT